MSLLNISNFILKFKRRFRSEIVTIFRSTSFFPLIYKSYWHYLFSSKKNVANPLNYYSAIPNPGAGIGHQMANWISGYWFARQFGLQFAHIPFSSSKWESFLGFGEGEIAVTDLINKGYMKIRLPFFDELKEEELSLQKKIINSYSNQKVVFVAEQDQYYSDQCGVMESIKQKYHKATERANDKLIFDPKSFNIAIHVRRGDIVIGQENQNPNLLMRWQSNDYFEKVLQTTVSNIKSEKPIAIYLFSQGQKIDFPEFEKFENLHFCLDMNAQDSFLHMVNADLLITSKSSFSYKPALLSNGIKICPKDFWHGYPELEDFVLVDNDGNFKLN
ncbi:hypothetical protein [Flavobacterium eburneipallidum]|uniref:hypothetical protein n=1 Tax=Flavobacterium eburneipallidum TaxID=3003263 RepID=UPI002482E6D1|nr:hypothetical protein [Flavobacterium eburneipallidum]